MTIIGIGSGRGAPGVTTAAMLLARCVSRTSFVVEADLSGGVLATRYGLGREPGLASLAATGLVEPGDWRLHAQDAGGVGVLVGPDAPVSARALWRRAEEPLTRSLDATDALVIADLGRLGDHIPMLDSMRMVILVARPFAADLVTLTHWTRALWRPTCLPHVGVVLVGDGDYHPNEVAAAVGVDVIGTLPLDPRAAAAIASAGAHPAAERSRLVRAAGDVAASVDSLVRIIEREAVVRR